ncbi:CHAT domain-containing protein [bacterium]|nr:CHAT domain-containing protein [bacterium]
MLLSLGCAADETWELLQQGRPGLARQRLKSPSLLQLAQIAQAEGDRGEAWRLVRQLETLYQPGQQPPEFFWLRALLLGNEQWNLAEQNVRGVLETSKSDVLRLQALCFLAQGLAQHDLSDKALECWLQAAHLASEMPAKAGPWLVHLALSQARQQLHDGQPAQALNTLVAARGLARWPALEALVYLQLAEVEGQLADWPALARHCQSALRLARRAPEPWLVERVCAFWVDRQLARSSDLTSVHACLTSLRAAEKWFVGAAQLAVLSQQARLQSLGLNQTGAALATLDRAIERCPPDKREVWLLAERFRLTPRSQKTDRRRLLGQIQQDLAALGPLQPEDLVSQRLPRFGIWAALADTYLPEQPQKAEEYFQKSLESSLDRSSRLRVVSYQLQRYASQGALTYARKCVNNLLEMLRSAPLDQQSLAVVREQMVELNSGSRHLVRLLFTDDIHPPAESPIVVFLRQLLREEALQAQLDKDIYLQIRQAQNPQEACQAYLARAQLLLAQRRGPEAALAAEQMVQQARLGGFPLQQALGQRMLAEIRWAAALYPGAIDACTEAERLYAASGNAQDQQSALDCKLLRAYFLMRTGRPQEALLLCQQSKGPWFAFLGGRCQLELGHRAEAARAFASCIFEEELAEVARLVFLARCSDQPDSIYQKAYTLALKMDSVVVRDICLDWAARLRQSGQEQQASELENETRARLTRLFQEYPADTRDRLLDEPQTQRLFHSRHAPLQPETASRQSRRAFLASLNEVRQRYPRMDNELAISPADLVALQEVIPADRVLVQYFSGNADLYAMRVDSHGCQLIQLAVERTLLQEWVTQLRQALSRRQDLPELPARRLYLSLVASLGPGLEGKQIQVIPASFFYYLPWDVLKDLQGHYLVENLDWSCVAPSELLRTRFRADSSASTLPQLVALGGSNPALPATAEEARLVASLFAHSQALIGPEANSKELIRWAPKAELLHVATHSGLSRTLNQTYIELSDGPFSLEQVYGLNLLRGSRVVLSSCESALGQTDPGREVSSLATAFLAGGASTVVATLWRVEDNTSAAFFQRFYPHLLKLGSTSKALRQTRLDCLADPALRAPWGWGAYQLFGEP